RKALSGYFDFLILDLMLPGMDGMEVCRTLRQEKVETPILMLTAKDSEIEKIIGLELGADDYMTKPFSPREVLARMKAIFRRSDRSPVHAVSSNLRFEGLIILKDRFEVQAEGKVVSLTPKEYELLLFLAERPGRVLSREQLLEAVWAYEYEGETRIVDVHISNLRDKIETDSKSPRYILTVRGFGYKFDGESV